jgi:hypothetical protein
MESQSPGFLLGYSSSLKMGPICSSVIMVDSEQRTLHHIPQLSEPQILHTVTLPGSVKSGLNIAVIFKDVDKIFAKEC